MTIYLKTLEIQKITKSKTRLKKKSIYYTYIGHSQSTGFALKANGK